MADTASSDPQPTEPTEPKPITPPITPPTTAVAVNGTKLPATPPVEADLKPEPAPEPEPEPTAAADLFTPPHPLVVLLRRLVDNIEAGLDRGNGVPLEVRVANVPPPGGRAVYGDPAITVTAPLDVILEWAKGVAPARIMTNISGVGMVAEIEGQQWVLRTPRFDPQAPPASVQTLRPRAGVS